MTTGQKIGEVTKNMLVVGGANEFSVAAPSLVEGIAKSLGVDLKGYDAEKELEGFKEAQPETVLMMLLPWVAASGGAAVRRIFPRQSEAEHAQILSNLGIPEDRAKVIAAEKNPARQRAMQAEEWAKIPAEVKHQLIRDADAKNLAAKQTGQFTEAPSILKQVGKDEDGQPQDVYHVLHEDGSLAYSTSDLQAADKIHGGLLLSFAKNKQKHNDPPRASWNEVKKGDRWDFVKKLMPKEAESIPLTDITGTPQQVYDRIEQMLLKEPIVTDPWGGKILVANPEGRGPAGLGERAKHLAAPRKLSIGSGERIYEEHKARTSAALFETIRNAQAKVEQGSEILYFRKYSNGLIHMVAVNKLSGKSAYGAYDGGLLSQYTPEANKRFEGAKMLETRTQPPASVQDGAVVGNNPKVKTQESTQAATPPESQAQTPSSGTESQGMKTDVNPPSQENRFTLPRLEEGDSTGKQAEDLLQYPSAADVSPELQIVVDKLAAGMNGHPLMRDAASGLKILDYSSRESRSSKAAVSFIRSFEKLTGKQVVVIDSPGTYAPFAGVVVKSHPNTIFLHARGDRNVMALIGHEWLHTVRQENKALYKDLRIKLLPLVDNWMARAKENGDGFYHPSEYSKEFTANIVGDAFAHPDFWKYLSQENRPLYLRVLQSVKEWFASFMGEAHQSEWGTEGAMKDIHAVHQAVMSTLEQQSSKTVGSQAPPP
ncbi:hypothetical protein BH10PLA2_BH10PLA2_20530 [soil metagenome]